VSISSGSNNTGIGYNTFSIPGTDENPIGNSTAIGCGSTPFLSNQIMLGRESEHTYMPGIIPSYNTTTGALIVVGGVGIGGNMYVGEDVYIKNVKVTTGPSSQWTQIGGNIYYNGNVGINMNVTPQYALDVSGRMNITAGEGYDRSVFRVNNINNTINNVNFHGNLISGGLNGININNDVGIIWGSDLNTQTSNFVIAPRSTNAYGLKITRDGKVGINLATPNATLDINGNLTVRGVNPSYIRGNLYAGNVEAYIFNATSDYRVKENPILLNDTFYVDDLKPRFYKNKLSNREDMGFLAHEVQEIFPFLVNGEKDGSSYQSVNYNGFIALLVKEIQELKKRLKTTEHQLQIIMDKLAL
jgi:hypothetical protein